MRFFFIIEISETRIIGFFLLARAGSLASKQKAFERRERRKKPVILTIFVEGIYF